MSVAELLTHLFSSYVLVHATKFSKEEQKVALIFWNLKNPSVIVYNLVKELVALAKSVNVPKTKSQIFNIGVEMIRKTQAVNGMSVPRLSICGKFLNPTSQPLIMPLN